MAKSVAKGRIAEQEYAARLRKLMSARAKKAPGRTPWKSFFAKGVGASIVTPLAKASLHSIIYSYGRAVGKRFVCSLTHREDGSTLVCIREVRDRKIT